jgi:hypothetical protein
VRAVTVSAYESWFVSARDPVSAQALWIRRTRHRPRQGPESAALWCTVVDGEQRPAVVKQVFADFPADVDAGPARFRGQAVLDGRTARWDLAVASGELPLRPLRPPVLYRAPLPRTKLVASVPDGLVTGTLEIDGRDVAVSGWRGTVGHNWGSEHADSWVWLHAAGFDTAPESWLDLVLARIRAGRALLPWTAFGALSLGGTRIPLGGLGRRSQVDARPGRLTATVPLPRGQLQLTVATTAARAVQVRYADPKGGSRAVSHHALARVELTLHRPGDRPLTLSTSSGGAYEYGTSQQAQLTDLVPLPDG